MFYSPPPGHAERNNSPPPGLLTSTKNDLLPNKKESFHIKNRIQNENHLQQGDINLFWCFNNNYLSHSGQGFSLRRIISIQKIRIIHQQSTPQSSSHCVAPYVLALVGISTCPHPLPPGQEYLKKFPTPGPEGPTLSRGVSVGEMVTARIEPCITCCGPIYIFKRSHRLSFFLSLFPSSGSS